MTSQRILVVDDIEMNRVLTQAVLRAATYDVDSVADGAAALRALDAKAYDLVLMDLDMPGLDGYSAAAAIRDDRAFEEGPRPHVVALSARTSADARARAREVGMADHIGRPISPRDLIREVGRLIAMPRDNRPCTWRKETYEALVARLGSDRMHAFLRTFLGECELLLTMIAGASRREIERRAHDMVSVGGMLGFEDLSGVCFDLQAPDRAMDPDVLSGLDRTLRAAIVGLHHVLDDEASVA